MADHSAGAAGVAGVRVRPQNARRMRWTNLTQSASELLKSQEEYFSKHKPGKAAPKPPEG